MNIIGVIIGVFIIAIGFLTLEPTLGRQADDTAYTQGRIRGMILMLFGALILIVSLVA